MEKAQAPWIDLGENQRIKIMIESLAQKPYFFEKWTPFIIQ